MEDIIFPIMKPVAVLTAMSTWNDVMTPLDHVRNRKKFTTGTDFQTQFGTFITWHSPLISIFDLLSDLSKQIINGAVTVHW